MTGSRAVALLLLLTHAAAAQPPSAPLPTIARIDSEPVIRLPLAEFVARVGRLNLDYAAQTFNVPIADAQVSVAHLFPNPTLSWGAGIDIAGQHQATSYDVALTQSILIGGKRHARTDVARGQLEAAKAQLDDFLRTLRGTAATAYIDAAHAEQVYARKRQTAEDLNRLVILNEHRARVGDAAEIDLVQSRVDAAQFRAALVSAANDVRVARLTMAGLLTPRRLDTLVAPVLGAELVSLPAVDRDAPITPALLQATPAPRSDSSIVASAGPLPSLDSLTQSSVASRPDVIAAHRQLEAAQAGVRVARADRWSDIDISVGTSYFTRGTNTLDPTPKFSALNLGLAFPLPLSNFTHGELNAARYTAKQAEKTAQSVEWKATLDVRQAWTAYQAAMVQIGEYKAGVLIDAERVRRAKLYSYQHGSATLLDVLTAEQTANDVYVASYDALQQYGHALIALGQATNTWSFVYSGLTR